MLAFSFLFLCIGLFIVWNICESRLCHICVSLTTLVLLILTVLYLVSDQLTGSGFDESVLYHLDAGLEGSGFRDFLPLIAGGIFFLVGSAVVVFFLYRRLSVKKAIKTKMTPAKGVAASVFFIAAVVLHPMTRDTAGLIYLTEGGDFNSTYLTPQFQTEPDAPPNVVVIYLESLERTYLDEAIFSGLAENLIAFEENSISFTDIDDTWGTGWTVAGMMASQCATPLVTSGSGRNSMHGMSEFMPEAICVGDILNSRGYNLSFMGGAHLKFAGKGKFYQSHGFSRVMGSEELRDKVQPTSYLNSWGLFDDSLFELAFDEFRELSRSEKPFGLFLLTLDTHHPDGYPSGSCKELDDLNHKNSMLSAVACSDFLVGKFINRILGSDVADNTVIVILSDHLSMPNNATDLLEKGQRKNLFVIHHPGKTKPEKISREGSTLDVAPTVLSFMGFENRGFGFGRSLFDDSPTLRESEHDLADLLKSFKKEIQALWHFPSLDGGMFLSPEEQILSVGGRSYELPVLFKIGVTKTTSGSDDLVIDEIHFNDYWGVDLFHSITGFSKGDKYIWIDECDKLSLILTQAHHGVRERYCILGGALGSAEPVFIPLGAPVDMPVSEFFTGMEFVVDQQVYDDQMEALEYGIPLWKKNMLDGMIADIQLKHIIYANSTNETRNPAELLQLSFEHYQAKDFELSIIFALKALIEKPDYAAAYNNICAAFNELSSPEFAIRACNRSLAIDPDSELAKGNLAWSNRLIRSQKQGIQGLGEVQ